jgi:hypothetical protein
MPIRLLLIGEPIFDHGLAGGLVRRDDPTALCNRRRRAVAVIALDAIASSPLPIGAQLSGPGKP